MNRFLPSMSSRWTYAGLALGALFAFGQLTSGLAHPPTADILGIVVSIVLAMVTAFAFGYLAVLVAYAVVNLVRH